MIHLYYTYSVSKLPYRRAFISATSNREFPPDFLIVFVGGIAIGVGFLIFLGASKVFEFYTEDYADTMSLAVFLISLAVSVYFAEPIRVVIPINLLLQFWIMPYSCQNWAK